MEEEYMDAQEPVVNEVANRVTEGNDNLDNFKDYGDIIAGYEDSYDDEDGGNNFRSGRGRGNFRGRGRGPPNWMNGPPMRFRGRGYGPGGPPMRGRGFYRGRGGPRGFGPNNGPSFDNNWGPMGPPPPGMMGGPPPGMMGGPPPFGPPPGMMPPGGPMGPPPNMMGQPPPFGGPPGMPPPNMPAPELWVETKSEEGKPYYYHARTRETTWTRPQEGPTCKVITQAEIEAMAVSGQIGNMGGPGGMSMGGPMGGMGMMGGGGPPSMMPPAGALAGPPGAVPPFMNQPPPWVKDGKDKLDEASLSDNDDLPPGETAPITQPPNGGMGGFGGGAGAGGGGGGGPGGFPGAFPGAWGGWSSWPPPLVAQPPPALNNAAVPDSGAATQMSAMGGGPAQMPLGGNVTPLEPPTVISDSPPPSMPAQKEEIIIPQELVMMASEWSAHRAPDGRPYYYHAGNQESVWEKPRPMRQLEELQAKIAAECGDKLDKDKIIEIDDGKIEVIDVEAHAEAAAAAEAERQAAAERQVAAERERQLAADRERQAAATATSAAATTTADKDKQDKDKQDKDKAKQDRSRPISSTPILGTPWCVVWTGDGSVFFYNSAAHSSVWERPALLLGRADVDKAVNQPPAALLDLSRKEPAGGGGGAGAGAGGAGGAGAKANGDLKRAADSSSDDSVVDSTKKLKAEDTPRKSALPSLSGGGSIDVGAAAAMEAEARAARERGALPHEQRLRAFLQMLHEKHVSAFSTWEKELHKIVFDPRYLMLNSKERRQVFDQYVRERAEEERKEKKNRLQQKKAAFKLLMEEAKLHSKSSFTDFTSKHGRDERYKGIEKARDRETYFNEHLADLRKREKEEKEKMREQAKTEFIALLKEKIVDRHARWVDAKKKVDSDARYKAVESSTLREDYYKEYCKLVKDERKKEKDGKEKKRERTSTKKDKRDKDRDKDKEKEPKKDKKKEKADEEERKQPTPPPDQWADILGIPGEEDSKSSRSKTSKKTQDTSSKSTSEDEVPSPKQLRSSKKEVPTPEKAEKSPIKPPPKKRKQEFQSPEPEEVKPKKTEKKKTEKSEKTEKKKRKKSEKD